MKLTIERTSSVFLPGRSFAQKPRAMLITLTVLLFSPLVTLRAAEPAAAPRRPNLIYILLDDAGYGDLGCYGQKTLLTPHIDRLAREGMKFTRHYAGSTVCAPSRGTLLTGSHSR
jgi:Sulfatase